MSGSMKRHIPNDLNESTQELEDTASPFPLSRNRCKTPGLDKPLLDGHENTPERKSFDYDSNRETDAVSLEQIQHLGATPRAESLNPPDPATGPLLFPGYVPASLATSTSASLAPAPKYTVLTCNRDHCNEVFSGKFASLNLKRHVITCHFRRPDNFGCYNCEKTFESINALRFHERRHQLPEKPVEQIPHGLGNIDWSATVGEGSTDLYHRLTLPLDTQSKAEARKSGPRSHIGGPNTRNPPTQPPTRADQSHISLDEAAVFKPMPFSSQVENKGIGIGYPKGSDDSSLQALYGLPLQPTTSIGDKSPSVAEAVHFERSKGLNDRPTQGDWVLIREMDPNRPDIAPAVSQGDLSSDYGTESSPDEEPNTEQPAPLLQPATSAADDPVTNTNQRERESTSTAEVVLLPAVGSSTVYDMSSFEDEAVMLLHGEVITMFGNQLKSLSTTNEKTAGQFAAILSDYRSSLYKLRDKVTHEYQRSSIDALLTRYDTCVESQSSIGLNSTIDARLERVPEIKPEDQSDEDDRRSVRSLESSTTLISSFSGLTVVGLECATVELQKIFQEDADLVGLYHQAIKCTVIGPERLKRNLRRLLRLLAQDLRQEASQELEKVTCRFVSTKAGYIAQCIVEEFNDNPLKQQPRYIDFEQFQPEAEDLDELAPVDEDELEDLPKLRTFLVDSAAFQNFREELTRFVLPKELRSASGNDIREDTASSTALLKSWDIPKAIRLTLETLLVVTGCLEPLLQPNMIRLRWTCRCGDRLFGDVREFRDGGVSKLVQQLQRTGADKITSTPYDGDRPNQHYIPWPSRSIRKAASIIKNAFSKTIDGREILPRHSVVTTLCPEEIGVPPVLNIVLLGCVNKRQGGKGLRQDSIVGVKNSRQLFYFMQQEYWRTREMHWLARYLRKVTSIQLTKFHLRLNNDVEPRLHKPCCREDACQCIPTILQPEYDCTPSGPLDFGPPILPTHMLHYFMHPELIDEEETTILDQIPKRMCGKLSASGKVLTEGWGLDYEEDWNIELIICAIAGSTILASIVFGICWTLKQADIQGAWGVSSYMITTCALVVALLSTIGRGKR